MLRKIISIILIKRVMPKYEHYLSQSQLACKWCLTGPLVDICKIKKKDPKAYNGHRYVIHFWYNHQKKLIKILENILPEDELRMTRLLLLSSIYLDIMKVKGIETLSFQNNKGSPSGNCIGRTSFNIHLEDSLRRARLSLI